MIKTNIRPEQKISMISALIALLGVSFLVFSWVFRVNVPYFGLPLLQEREFLIALGTGFVASSLLIFASIPWGNVLRIWKFFAGGLIFLFGMFHISDDFRANIFQFLQIQGYFIQSTYLTQDILVSIALASLGCGFMTYKEKNKFFSFISDFFSLSIFVLMLIYIGSVVAAYYFFQTNGANIFSTIYIPGIFLLLSLALLYSNKSKEELESFFSVLPRKLNIADLRIPSKLIFSFGSLILLILLLSVTTISSLNGIEDELIRVRTEIDNVRTSTLRMHDKEQEMVIDLFYADSKQLLRNPARDAEIWLEEYSNAQKSLDQILYLFQWKNYKQQRDVLFQIKENLFAYHDNFRELEKQKSSNETTLRIQRKLSQQMDIIDSNLSLVEAEIHLATENLMNWIRLLFFVISTLFIVIAVFFAVYMSRLISLPILHLKNAADKIASGFLHYPIPVLHKDEIGTLGGAIHKMRVALLGYIDNEEKISLELKKANAKDEALLSSMGDGVIALNSKHIIEYINPHAEKILGVEKDTLLGKDVIKGFPLFFEDGLPVAKKLYPLSLQKKVHRVTHVEQFFVKNKGKLIPVLLSISPIILGRSDTGTIITIRDISKEREMDKAKTEFISLASHQLRTPLTAMRWYVELLLGEEQSHLTPTQREYLQEAYHSTERMSRLVTALLNVSRIELGKFTESPEKTDINGVIATSLKELSPILREKKVHVNVEVAKDVPLLYVDPKLVGMVCGNIIANSVKYSQKNGTVQIIAKMLGKRNLPLKEREIQLTFIDHGYGIPAGQVDKVFTKLFRADNVRQIDADGTGLGLYIVKSVVEQFHGTIRFETKEGQGTTFYVTLPLQKILYERS